MNLSPTTPTTPTTPSAAPSTTRDAWHDAELANPHAAKDKAGKVRGMFAAIASSYDLNNHVHSLWQDVRWRKFAVRMAQVRAGESVLDVACGTGDLTQEFAASTHARSVVGVDFTHEMLVHTGHKREALRSGIEGPRTREKISYVEGDAMDLPFADASFDVVSIAFGIRNVSDPAKALLEFARVLRPGGRLIILEFDQPRLGLVRWFNAWYCGTVMPVTATWISGDKSGAYRYLPRSVTTFMNRSQMHGAIATSGLTRVESWSLSLGLCACYRAYKAR
jgi:demethylmenaquinone methyltransferase/2-methoxy-6-polyprenyl-1,4-benzoquinol methylase